MSTGPAGGRPVALLCAGDHLLGTRRPGWLTRAAALQKVDALAQTHPALKATPQHLRASAYIHIRLAELGRKYADLKQARQPAAGQNSAPDSTTS